MKYLLSALLFCGTLSGFSQTPTPAKPGSIVNMYPHIDNNTVPQLRIIKVEVTDDYTIFTFSYTMASVTDFSQTDDWIQILPDIQLIAVGGKRRFTFAKTEDIPVAPEKYHFLMPGKKYFKVFFQKLEPGIEVFDIFECVNNDLMRCFNFYGVHIRNPELPKPVVTPAEKKAEPVVTISGKILDAVTRKPLAARLVMEVLPSQRTVGNLTVDAGGNYKLTVPPRSVYTASASAKGYFVYEENINLLKVTTSQTLTKNFYLKPVEVGETVALNNIFFPQAEATLLAASYGELDKLVKLMKGNPNMEILLEGHTDIIGNAADNVKLSQDRVNVVKAYLVQKGIVGTRIQTKAWGGEKPIKTEGSDDERSLNRRVEFKILKK
jgi:OmpA-OmpF porin, OOP family